MRKINLSKCIVSFVYCTFSLYSNEQTDKSFIYLFKTVFTKANLMLFAYFIIKYCNEMYALRENRMLLKHSFWTTHEEIKPFSKWEHIIWKPLNTLWSSIKWAPCHSASMKNIDMPTRTLLHKVFPYQTLLWTQFLDSFRITEIFLWKS